MTQVAQHRELPGEVPDTYAERVGTTEGVVEWTAQGKVNAQNGFGAMLRSTWQVMLFDLGDNSHFRARVDWIR